MGEPAPAASAEEVKVEPGKAVEARTGKVYKIVIPPPCIDYTLEDLLNRRARRAARQGRYARMNWLLSESDRRMARRRMLAAPVERIVVNAEIQP